MPSLFTHPQTQRFSTMAKFYNWVLVSGSKYSEIKPKIANFTAKILLEPTRRKKMKFIKENLKRDKKNWNLEAIVLKKFPVNEDGERLFYAILCFM